MTDDFGSFKSRPKTPWHKAKSIVLPDGTIAPAPPEEPRKPAAPEPIGLPAYIKEGTSTADGWRRVIEFLRVQIKRNPENGDQVRTAAQKFVQDYPGSVQRVDNDTWTGMKLALDAYVSQDPAFWRSMQ
jgi:hypothetical protein